jgi:membrane-associated phospholipid phosphatase
VSTRLTARTALVGAAIGVALLVVVWFCAFHVGVVRQADQSILQGFYSLGQRGRVHSVASWIANLCDPKPYVYLVWIPVVVALLRRRPGLAIAAAVILLGANVTTEVLKSITAVPRPLLIRGSFPPVDARSWPSGHATAAMSLALCCVLVAPERWRPAAAALGAAFTVAVVYSFLALGWHYPTDVLGGFLMVTTWTLATLSGLLAVQKRRAGPGGRTVGPSVTSALGPSAAAVLAAIFLAVGAALARPHDVVSYARAHEAFTIGAVAIGAVALALATGLMLAVRR